MKKILACIFIFIFIFSVTFSIPLTSSAEALYVRKIVSVVFDDSGSMIDPYADGTENLKHVYANYAMQAFCGMLNSGDQLYITYMSDILTTTTTQPCAKSIDLSSNRIQSSVDSIRNHNTKGGTPYNSMDCALNQLKNAQDTNPNTQYWLVVITDGVFDVLQQKYQYRKDRETALNARLEEFASQKMPNGTYPQITFLTIGDISASNNEIVFPTQKTDKGIFAYNAADATDIIATMAEMASKISGRTQVSDVKQLNGNTVQVSSTMPLLNIAALNQGVKAKISKVTYSDTGQSIPVSREAELLHSKKAELVGGAYLIGDSQTVINAGTYNITFDRDIDAKNVVLLFEPALEVRMEVTLNGEKLDDFRKLEQSMENDVISVSCKVYEMGTDKEITSDVMPAGTTYKLAVSEGSTQVAASEQPPLQLEEYTLKNTETRITSSVAIPGFRPIEASVKFTPTVYVPKIDYTIEATYGGDTQNVKLDDIATNKALTICFTVYADGAPITDAEAVKALNPVISVLPQGNNGNITYSDDGKIIFTPNSAAVTGGMDSFEVDVTLTIDDGTTATKKYTVLIADYKVIPTDAEEAVKKTGFYGNTVGVQFYITKDGVRLNKTAVENDISVKLNEQYEMLDANVTVSEDGLITVIPQDKEEHKLTFWNWWVNWAYYFSLPGDDVTVTLSHPFGTADATVNVVPETVPYQIFNVYLPLVIEVILLAVLITWIILVVTKPRYAAGATLYVADIRYNRDSCTHIVRNFSAVKLSKFNKIKRGNGRLKFKKTADVVSANGIKIRADHGGRIICEMNFPWYRGQLTPTDYELENMKRPSEVQEYFNNHRTLEINEFATTETVEAEHERGLAPANPHRPRYYVVPDQGNGVTVIDERRVIRNGKIFVYING